MPVMVTDGGNAGQAAGSDGTPPGGGGTTGRTGTAGPSNGGGGVGASGGAAANSGGAGANGGAAASSGNSSQGEGGMSGSAGNPADAPGCQGNEECGGSRPVCQLNTTLCVQCQGNEDCGMQQCDMTMFTCVECLNDEACGGRHCDRGNHKCVDCNTDPECTDTKLGTCNADHKCVDCSEERGCAAPTPACVNESCYECDNNEQCLDPQKHRCLRKDHICVECLNSNNDDCSSSRPVCDSVSCVECLADTDCASRHCAGKVCVECEVDGDCGDPNKAQCSNNECVPCNAQDQCSHLNATRACDVSVGRCVECIDDKTCPNTSCLRRQQQCSDVPVGSIDACSPCEADTQCKSTMKCVFDGGADYCLYKRSEVSNCATSATSSIRPYNRSVQSTSLDGAQGPYCAPHAASCEAYLAAANVRGCGMGCPSGGVCDMTLDHCTYGCNGPADCPRNQPNCSVNICTLNSSP